MPDISFLILTYNSGGFVGKLLDSIFELYKNLVENRDYEVIVFDNASTDNTLDIVKNHPHYKDIKLFENRQNLGYAKGIDSAAKNAEGNLLVVINPDSKIIGGDFDKVIDKFEADKNLAVAGLTIKMPDGTSEKNAGKFFNPLTFLLYSLGLERVISLRFSPSSLKKVDFVSGGFVVFRRMIFERLHGYDEDYFMYVEDMDFCYRAKKEGFDVCFMPYVTIEHKGQGSSNREFAIVNIYRGITTFYEKHGSLFMQQYVKNLLTLKAALIIFVSAILGKKETLSTYSKALKSIK